MADRQLRSARNLGENAPADVIRVNYAFPQRSNKVEFVEILRSQFTTPVWKLRKLFAQELLESFRFKAVVSAKMKFFRVIFLSFASFSSH
jgi:hypothetical protein